ncbi:hypothetical protein Ddye_028184 [Dipteronia dyeriana]|uniref:Disease resistance protein At4g27190-like leucine-rich repeats domain-containing protein n=1 Tax=Dipteronia dyeriana TaxID=168575 RepID=A0AAD9TQH8_9ROSI|nr:hypothetical protein Ddye_028184 [Dipteronia dyeriana]
MVEIFAIGGDDDVNNTEVIHKIQISRLRSVNLTCLPRLKSFCSKVKAASPLQLTSNTNAIEIISEDELGISMPLFNEKVAFPNLETLNISEMFLEKIWHNQLPTLSSCVQSLASLIIKACYNLKELFLSSMVNSFVQLQYLKICHCWGMEEMVVTDKLREEERISFPQLNFLKIKGLRKLRRLYSGNYIEFSSLKEFEIRECSELKEFIFDDKVGFPSLEEIYISYMDNLEMIWHNQIAGDSFYKLKTFDVHECKKLLVVLPSNMFGRFSRLESMNVISCGSVEEIFDLRGINFEERHSVESTRLRKLSIINLPNLKNIWNKDPGRTLSFGHLQKLRVGGCQSLKNLFPASVAKGLSELEYLSVSDCGVEEIVAKEGEAVEEEPTRFLFPKMISLKLHNLPKLRTFYPGRHTIEGPVLKNLELYHCGKVRIFISEVLSIQELDIPTQQPLFVIGKAFPCLEELNLVGKNITMMWQVQFPERPLHKLKILEIGNDESTVLPLGIIQSFHNLETFSLFFWFIQRDIFI